MSYNRLFTSEAVSEGHPDKVADQISDAILDNFLTQDDSAHVAVETMVTTGQVIVAGEVTSEAYVDVQKVVRDTIRRIGYTKPEYGFEASSCGVLTAIHEQSPDINQGVSRGAAYLQGAGDQGIMFGYACNETKSCMPATLYLANLYVKTLAEIRREGKVMTYLRPDAKSQVTLEYDGNGRPFKVDTIVISTQHDEFGSDEDMMSTISEDISKHLELRVSEKLCAAGEGKLLDLYDIERGHSRMFINPTGKFVIGGPAGDTGLTGRKIICDTYGGYGAHGGGAFSGKDPSKVDRSAAYAARYIAKNIVANKLCDNVLIQLSYAIGVAAPVSVSVKAEGIDPNFARSNEEIADFILRRFDLTPYGIECMLHLRKPIYEPTAAYGHFGREPYTQDDPFAGEVQFFPWERVMDADSLVHIEPQMDF